MKRLLLASLLVFLALLPATAQAAPPTITETTFSAVSTTSATLEATINPGGKSTPYHFEYGTTDCATGPCTAVPTPDAPAGNGTAPLKLTFPLTGLSPDTTYHFRLLAKNSESPLDPETNEREYLKGPEAIFTTHALPPAFPSCPNEAFRKGLPSAQLPDCRAYEQATPLNKNAGEATSVPWLQAAADDGNAVTFLSDSGFPDAEGAQDMPLYLATRNATGWSSQGVLPSGTLAPHDARILGWNSDLDEVFSLARNYGAPVTTSFLSRPGSGSGTRTITPFTPKVQYAYADSSADGNLVLFEEVAQAAAGNGTSTLWLWNRQTNARSEVSVLNGDDGSPAPVSAFAGPYDWVNGTTAKSLSEGGSNRTYYTHDSNVLADAASAVFFTAAATGQLYLRKNPTEDQSPMSGGKCTDPALACTINVSVSRRTVCADGPSAECTGNPEPPLAPDPAGTRETVFHAASADGTKVFFTSAEKLTDDANTGPTATHPPAIARAPIDDGDPAEVEFLPARATDVAVDDTYLYWIDPDTEAIARAPKDDGVPLEPEFIPAATTDNPKGLTVSDEFIYWTNAGDDVEGEGGGSIGRAEIDGENPDEDFIPGEVEESPGVFKVLVSQPRGIDVDDDFVYWVNRGVKSIIGAEVGWVARAGIDGGPASVEPKFIELATTDVAVNASHVYYSIRHEIAGANTVRRVKLDGTGSFENIVSFPDTQASSLALDASHIYWTKTADSAIGRANLDGSNPDELLDHAGSPEGLALGGGHLYWSANQEILPNPGADLYRYDSDTDELTDLSVDPDSKNGAEVVGVLGASADGSRVYFAANGVLDEEPNLRDDAAQPGNCTPTGSSGTCNLYFTEGGDTRFIATIAADDRNWVPGPYANTFGFDARPSRLSSDGRYLLFTSSRQLTDYDNAGVPVLYRYDAESDTVLCASCNPSGERPATSTSRNGFPTFSVPSLSGTLRPSAEVAGPSGSFLTRALSADGERIFFETIDGLVGADTDGLGGCPVAGSFRQKFPSCIDVYEWQAPDTDGCEKPSGCLYLLSPGDDDSPSFFAGASATGDDAFIFTRAQLVGSDTDQLRDVYDLRVGGGLASQYPVPPDICDAADSCKLGPTPSPPTPSPGTAGFQGLGDPLSKRPRRCRKRRRAPHSAKSRSQGRKPGCRRGPPRRKDAR